MVRAHRHLPTFTKPDAIAGVELHWSIQHPDRELAVDTDGLIERSVELSLGGAAARPRCPEDLLLHVAVHMAYEDEFLIGMRQVCDVALTIERYKDQLDWVTIQKRAQSWNALRGVALALTMARRWLGTPVPENWPNEELAKEIEDILPVVRQRIF